MDERSLSLLAETIAAALCGGSQASVRGSQSQVAAVIREAIEANFKTEQAINREAERTFEALGSSTSGMDRGKLIAGMRERIAKSRGFVL